MIDFIPSLDLIKFKVDTGYEVRTVEWLRILAYASWLLLNRLKILQIVMWSGEQGGTVDSQTIKGCRSFLEKAGLVSEQV